MSQLLKLDCSDSVFLFSAGNSNREWMENLEQARLEGPDSDLSAAEERKQLRMHKWSSLRSSNRQARSLSCQGYFVARYSEAETHQKCHSRTVCEKVPSKSKTRVWTKRWSKNRRICLSYWFESELVLTWRKGTGGGRRTESHRRCNWAPYDKYPNRLSCLRLVQCLPLLCALCKLALDWRIWAWKSWEHFHRKLLLRRERDSAGKEMSSIPKGKLCSGPRLASVWLFCPGGLRLKS